MSILRGGRATLEEVASKYLGDLDDPRGLYAAVAQSYYRYTDAEQIRGEPERWSDREDFTAGRMGGRWVSFWPLDGVWYLADAFNLPKLEVPPARGEGISVEPE